MKNLKPVILCGGSGTRLWPMSREQYPKQLLPLVSNDTLLQATLKRCRVLDDELFRVARAIVICNEEYRFLTAEQMRAIGETEMQIILEPFGRNTAPALTLSALYASADGTDPILLVMPSDHIIENEVTFQRCGPQRHTLSTGWKHRDLRRCSNPARSWLRVHQFRSESG